MKEKQGNKPNSYGKLTKRMLIYLGIGGVCGFFVGIFMTFGVKNGMSDLSDLVRPLALPIIAVIFVVSIVLMEFYSRKLKDTMKHLEEAEDEQYEVLSYEEEKYGAMLMNCNVISQVCDIIVLTFTFPVLGWKKHREKSSPDSWQPVLCFVSTSFSMPIIRCVM